MSIERMNALIEQEARRQAQAILSAARQEAQHISHTGRTKAQARRLEILEDYSLRAREADERAQSELRSQAKHLRLAAQQELVEEAIGTARTLFDQRSEAQELDLLARVLHSHIQTAGGERPTVLVQPGRVAAARAFLGEEVAVEEGDFEHGFILSFAHFDVNYLSSELFEAWRDSLEAVAAQQLFGGNDNEKHGP